jgi:hypothetical protein
MCVACASNQRSGTDLFGKGYGFNGGRESKFGCQHAAAGFVNIQCGAAPICARQHTHQLTVSGFAQGFIFKQTANGAFRFNQLTSTFVKLGKLFQRGRHPQAELFTLNEEPILKLRAIAEREFFHKFAAHQFERLRQPGSALNAREWIRMRVEATSLG